MEHAATVSLLYCQTLYNTLFPYCRCADVRENTIASLKNAGSAGADLVEFDVQLSKDLVPVLYHDFHVCIAMKRKKQLSEHDMLELPMKDLTLEQLQHLKVLYYASVNPILLIAAVNLHVKFEH
jgi:glycerophosphoryl diester phosphodiesterase